MAKAVELRRLMCFIGSTPALRKEALTPVLSDLADNAGISY